MMAPNWLLPVLMCALLVVGYAGVVPTQETMVVARSSDETATESSEASTTASPEPTSEEPLIPIKLTEMSVNSEVTMRYAHTAVVTYVKNPDKRAQEAVFRVLLPETAFISGFTMNLDGKSYKAYVKEKEEAKQIYTQAVSQGIGAAHISAKARDSNHFTVSVNVEPNTMAVFNLTYEELLVRRNGVYNHAINLHPGALVPKLVVTVHIKEGQKITALRVPEVRTGNEIDASEGDAQNANAVIKKSNNDHEAVITFKPDLEEQKRLMALYAEKTKESAPLIPFWRRETEEDAAQKEGVLGQFVVQYDVDRPKDGEILLNDGYFVHFFAPPLLPPLPKHVVFVLDTSGSMMDRKIVQLREAMQVILGELNSFDFFSLVEFASFVKVHDLKEADEPEKSDSEYPGVYLDAERYERPLLVPPSPAIPENVEKAKTIVKRLTATGATNIGSALDVAVELIQKGINGKYPKKELPPADVITTEEPLPQPEAKELVQKQNPSDEEGLKLEPIIIFLTDGDPTVGETSPKRIISRLSEMNSGPKRASIFSLAFGEDADRNFLRKLSLRNDGFMRHIYEAADAALQLRDFYRQVSSPLLSHVNFTYAPDKVRDVTKGKFRMLYAGGETVVAGRLAEGTTDIAPQLVAFCGVDDGIGRKKYEISPKIPIEVKRSEYFPLERLWAYLSIKQLLDERDAAEDSDKPADKDNGPEKKALALALKYEFVTPLTSLVVVKPNATNAVDAESVDKESYKDGPGGALSAPSYSFARPAVAQGLPSNLYSPALGFPDQDSGIFLEEESELDDIQGAGGSIYSPLAPAFPIAPLQKKPTTLATISPLEAYNLKHCSWLEPLLNTTTDTISFSVNGTNISLKLSKDNVAPKPASGDVECAHASDGAAGTCVYLSRCGSAHSLTAQTYSSIYCSVGDGYAGVCCPKADLDRTSETH